MTDPMNINLQTYQQAGLADEIGILSEFRLRFFREYPYLYVGSEDNEQKHLADYLVNPTTRLIVARETEKIIGVAIGTMLSTELNIVCKIENQLQQYEIQSQHCFYLGEMIAEPEYRRSGVGKRMLELLKIAGREQGADRFCFLAVVREPHDVRRPADYTDASESIFRKFGFEKTDISVTFEWNTIQPNGQVENVANRMDLWID